MRQKEDKVTNICIGHKIYWINFWVKLVSAFIKVGLFSGGLNFWVKLDFSLYESWSLYWTPFSPNNLFM